MRKIVVIFCATGNQKIRPSGKIKENILLEEISGYQSVVYFLPSVSGCYLAQLPLISIKSVLILLPINSFINRITLRFWRIIACSLLLYGAYIRWTPMDGFSTAILIIPCVWLGIAVQNPNTPFGIFIVIALLCGFAGANFASSMGNISFFFPKAKQGSALGINGGLGNLGVSVMQLVAPLVILYLYLPFSASMAYRRPTVR